jgi:hypothetical protein
VLDEELSYRVVLDSHSSDNLGKEIKVDALDATNEQIADFLNEKMENDPKWFGWIGPENIVKNELIRE